MEKIAALEDAIQKKSLIGIYSVFFTIAHGDPAFTSGKFMETLNYVKSKSVDGLMQEFDGEELKPESEWDEEYWALVASSLMDNFCMTRIEHLKKVGQKVYPDRLQNAARKEVKQPSSGREAMVQTHKAKGRTRRQSEGKESAGPKQSREVLADMLDRASAWLRGGK